MGKLVGAGCFQDEHWIYAYEACFNRWCGKKKIAGLIAGDSGAMSKFLIKERVTFLDLSAASKFVKTMSPAEFY